jgi:hypothetical protein
MPRHKPKETRPNWRVKVKTHRFIMGAMINLHPSGAICIGFCTHKQCNDIPVIKSEKNRLSLNPFDDVTTETLHHEPSDPDA